MKNIQMVDLKSQYNKIKNDVDAAILQVIDNTAFIKGPEVKEFETNISEYLGVKHTIGCANGTDALQIALMALDLKPGDEVIVPDFTFIATLEVVGLLGLKPVIVDVDYDNFTIDIQSVKKSITPKTKAIVPVHLFGQCCDMTELMRLAEKHNIYVIEDAAQSLGADYFFACKHPKKSCSMGTISCTSFFPSKNLGCYGDGGALFTNDDALAEKIKCVANHGMKVRYYHDMIGVNSRLDTIQAAVLNIKLKHLNDYNQSRQKAADYYDKAFNGIKSLIVPKRMEYSTHIFHQYTLKVTNGKRDELRTYLESKGIPAMVYYPVPLHVQQAFLHLGYKAGDFPVTEKLCKEVISLPMHTELDEEQLVYITNCVKEFFN